MAQKLSDLYLYLGKRDKTGVRFIAKFQGQQQLPTRIDDVATLQLPTGWAGQIDQIIFDARMNWEPWIESSDSFEELRSSLKVRGYTNVPVNGRSEFTPANIQIPVINTSYLPKKTTMLRKNS